MRFVHASFYLFQIFIRDCRALIYKDLGCAIEFLDRPQYLPSAGEAFRELNKVPRRDHNRGTTSSYDDSRAFH